MGCEENCTNGEIRLIDGASSSEGRVEICHGNSWGTICDSPSSHTWATDEAVVVCRQLDLPYTGTIVCCWIL